MNKANTFKFRCPSCNASIRAPAASVGRMIKCPGCKAHFAIPKDSSPSETLLLPGIEREEAAQILCAMALPDKEPDANFTPVPPPPPQCPATPPAPTITFVCGSCGYYGQAPLHYAGLTIACSTCGHALTVPQPPLADRPRGRFEGLDAPADPRRKKREREREESASGGGLLGVIAWILLLGGLAGLGHFFQMDTSVPTHSGGAFGLPDRVHNIGLMQNRQMGLMLSGGAFAVGVILIAMRARR